MDPEERVGLLEKENDALHEQLGIESPRMARAREVKEADEAHQRELAQLEISAIPEYLGCLERQGLHREWEVIDGFQEVALERWQAFEQVRADRITAKKTIENFAVVFGGSLPPSWQLAREEWLNRQPRRPEESTAQTWRRHRVVKYLGAIVGRTRAR